MIDEKTFKNILSNKSAIINILWYKLKDTENESWERTPQGTRQRTGDKIPIYELMTYGEAFLFEFGSFLDILIKFICGKDLNEDLYFNWTNISKLQPQDDFVKFLIQCYNQGVSNSPIYNLKKMKEYRNAITHATFLDISKLMMWEAGNNFPTLENNFYILPDNPCDDFSSYTYNQKIALFGFIEEMGKIFDVIAQKLNTENLYNKYSF